LNDPRPSKRHGR